MRERVFVVSFKESIVKVDAGVKKEQAALLKRYQWTVPDTAAPWPGAQQAALLR